MDWIEILITVIPDWVGAVVNVVVTAVPDFDNPVTLMVMSGFALILFMAWHFDYI